MPSCRFLLHHSRSFAPLQCALLLALPLAACARGKSGTTGTLPSPSPGGAPALPGLVSAAAGPGEVRVHWVEAPTGFEVALFGATSRSAVFTSAPIAVPTNAASATVAGLTDGVVYYIGLGIRPDGSAIYVPTGVVLRARPGAPIYVDAASTAVNPDGSSPATAFPDLTSGVLTAFVLGGANVWVRDGTYDAASLPLFAGVHVYGGFDGSFDLERRDVSTLATVWNVRSGASGVFVQGGDPPAILDGIALRGSGGGATGIDVSDSGIELRSIEVGGFSGRGVRLKNDQDEDFDVVVAHARIVGNDGEGLLGSGAFDLYLDGSTFGGNAQEGFELDELIALEGDTANLRISACSFSANASEGLDANLNAPPLGTSPGGRFAIEIRGSVFDRNGADGCLVDVDYESAALWSGGILLRESAARANGGSGFHVDADARAEVHGYLLLASANDGDGILVSSESDPGIAFVVASVSAGNLGAGIRASLGNRPIAAGHCIVAGNALGGVVSDTVESAAASCVAWLQPDPWGGTRTVACPSSDDPAVGMFENAPEEYAQVIAAAGASLTLAQPPSFLGASSLELDDDGALRTASQISGTNVILAQAPTMFAAPGALAAFAPGKAVVENYRLPIGSPAIAAGMAPPGAVRDAGIFGIPVGRDPGIAEPVPRRLFGPLGTSPAPAESLGSNTTIAVTFSDDLASASLVPGSVRAITSSGNELAITTTVSAGTLGIDPPPVGWGSEAFTIQLFDSLASTSGEPLASSVALPFTP